MTTRQANAPAASGGAGRGGRKAVPPENELLAPAQTPEESENETSVLRVAETAPTTEERAVESRQAEETRPVEPSKRRMPDNLRRFLIRLQGGKYYLPAAYRVVWFRDEFPDWGILTEIIEGGQEAGFATVKATIFNAEGRLIATGHKTETCQDFPAGWVEKAESGAVSRALALCGFGTQFTPELDDDGSRPADSPQPIGGRSDGSYRPRDTDSPAGRAREEERRRLDMDLLVNRQTAAETAGRPGAKPEAAAIWEGPGQCPRCHAPEGKRHGKPCIA